jgi:hypothetical protein
MSTLLAYLRAVSLCLAVAHFASAGTWDALAAAKPPPRAEALRYEATVEQINGASRQRTRVIYDSGRFRVEYFPGVTYPVPEYVELFDGSDPILYWVYQTRERTAVPSLWSCLMAMGREAHRLGEARARSLYEIPAEVRLNTYAPGERATMRAGPRPFSEYRSDLRPQGQERVAGYLCRIYSRRIISAQPDDARDGRDAPASAPARTVSAWVEPKSQLVLRFEERFEAPAVPPRRIGYRATQVRFPRAIPDPTFQLPAGTTVYLPRTLSAIPLPQGVKRETMKGPWAQVGLDYTGARSSQAQGAGAP